MPSNRWRPIGVVVVVAGDGGGDDGAGYVLASKLHLGPVGGGGAAADGVVVGF